MPKPSPTEFKAEYAEFRLLTDPVVQAKLDQAYRRVGESWGELRDDGAKLLTAHLLASSPLGEPSSRSVKGEKDSGSRTSYLDEFQRIQDEIRVPGAVVSNVIPLPPGD